MIIKVYEYVGSYGAGLVYDTDEKPKYYRESDEWKYVGTWDLPDDFIEKCLPITYIE